MYDQRTFFSRYSFTTQHFNIDAKTCSRSVPDDSAIKSLPNSDRLENDCFRCASFRAIAFQGFRVCDLRGPITLCSLLSFEFRFRSPSIRGHHACISNAAQRRALLRHLIYIQCFAKRTLRLNRLFSMNTRTIKDFMSLACGGYSYMIGVPAASARTCRHVTCTLRKRMPGASFGSSKSLNIWLYVP